MHQVFRQTNGAGAKAEDAFIIRRRQSRLRAGRSPLAICRGSSQHRGAMPPSERKRETAFEKALTVQRTQDGGAACVSTEACAASNRE